MYAIVDFYIINNECNGCKSTQKNNLETIKTVNYNDLKKEIPVVAMENGNFKAYRSPTAITIDGCSKDKAWETATWYDMNYLWMGEEVAVTDYYGRFKLSWDASYLYVLVEVTDDFLQPTLENGLENYWKGDYVEVFIDEDRSGGDHKYNHQAFAYHVSTEGHAIDLNTDQQPVFLDNHITVARAPSGNTHLWEMAIQLIDKNFKVEDATYDRIGLNAENSIGFSIAYGDNDGKEMRENFMGSKKSHGVNNDEGYVNADVFGTILLEEQQN
jgi:hypothetical protein